MPPAESHPQSVTIRMYQVGFGDCFLVSFAYAEPIDDDGRAERHILIDFGSTHSPWRGASLTDVAELIKGHSGGKLDVIVMTHRHKDHLSGFAIDAAAEIIDELSPSLVVRPWTEDPLLADDATAPAGAAASRGLVARLQEAEAFAAETAAVMTDADSRSLVGRVASLAATQVANAEAIGRLDAWAEAATGTYVAYGGDSGIQEVVPGVIAHVLGPPTVEQWPEMLKQRAVDPEEYWMLSATRLRDGVADDVGAAPLRGSRDVPTPGPVSWLVGKLEQQRLHSLHRIVRSVDDALNNTSIILLFEVGDKRLLFPGDAQIENWSFSLSGAADSEQSRSMLGQLDFYKVGHHGSRNATPKSLFNLWDSDPQHQMISFMSTRSGVHGTTEATHVPRRTLVEALERRTTLLTTDGLDKERPFVEATGPADGPQPLQVVER